MKDDIKRDQLLRLMFWETTIKCNLSCSHCRRLEDNEAAPSDMSTEEAKGLMDQLAELGKEQGFSPVIVFSGGEPLCRDDIFELIAYGHSLSLPLALATNGTLIDAAIARQIKDSGIARVAVSLDGPSGEFHDKIRQQEGSFDQAVRGIGHLRDNDIPFQVNITLTKHNAHTLDEVYSLVKSLGAIALHIFMLVPVGCGQVLAETDMLSPQEYEKMLIKSAELESLKEIQIKVTCGPHYERVIRETGLNKSREVSDAPGAGHSHGHGKSAGGCLAGLGVIFVSHQGDVFPCGYLPIKCGNILQDSLTNIWQGSEDLAKMRSRDELEGKCGLCGYRKVCGGCRARAFGLTGNYMAEEPFCSYIPPKASK